LSASVNDEVALVLRVGLLLHHALDGVGAEIAQILVDQRVGFDVGVLPLAVGPRGKTAGAGAHLKRFPSKEKKIKKPLETPSENMTASVQWEVRTIFDNS